MNVVHAAFAVCADDGGIESRSATARGGATEFKNPPVLAGFFDLFMDTDRGGTRGIRSGAVCILGKRRLPARFRTGPLGVAGANARKLLGRFHSLCVGPRHTSFRSTSAQKPTLVRRCCQRFYETNFSNGISSASNAAFL